MKTVSIVLFRGVGGATQLPVAPLREALTAAGFENVATYINSGNAVLRSALPREKVIAKVAKICQERRRSRSGSVGHTGDAIPVGTTAYQPIGPIRSLVTAGTGVAASHLRKGNHRFLVLVNRDIHQPTTAIIAFTDSTPAAQVARVAKDGAYHPLPAGLFKTTIAPGDVAILSWKRNELNEASADLRLLA